MKKQLLSLCLPVAMALTSFSANAAMILGIDAGYYFWQPSVSGVANTGGADAGADVSTLGYTDGSNGVTYLAFEHPVPIVPNVKLQMSEMAVTGTGTNSVDAGHTDTVLYYEILDNFVSVDVGVTTRVFDGSHVDGLGAPTVLNDTVYMLYTAAEVIIPFAGLSVGMEINKDIGLDDNTINDVKMRLRYQLVAGVGLELGQRTVTMSLKERAPVSNKLEFSGTYIAATYTF